MRISGTILLLGLMVCVGVSFVLCDDSLQSTETKEQETTDSRERLGDLVDELDFHTNSHGTPIVEKVEYCQGQQLDGIKIVKTKVPQSFSNRNFPVGSRFKRSFFDDVMNKLTKATNKVSGAIADGVNVGYEEFQRVKGEISNNLKH